MNATKEEKDQVSTDIGNVSEVDLLYGLRDQNELKTTNINIGANDFHQLGRNRFIANLRFNIEIVSRSFLQLLRPFRRTDESVHQRAAKTVTLRQVKSRDDCTRAALLKKLTDEASLVG
jgi:hypothetical protein